MNFLLQFDKKIRHKKYTQYTMNFCFLFIMKIIYFPLYSFSIKLRCIFSFYCRVKWGVHLLGGVLWESAGFSWDFRLRFNLFCKKSEILISNSHLKWIFLYFEKKWVFDYSLLYYYPFKGFSQYCYKQPTQLGFKSALKSLHFPYK